MPLRDHLRPPTSKQSSWEAVHGGWPMMIVLSITNRLPPPYVAHLRVHLGKFAEIDVSAYEQDEVDAARAIRGNGGLATATWAPAKPTLTIATDFPMQDEYEVRVYDMAGGQRLVAAIELVSPANKDRPEHRHGRFVAKCAALVQNQVSVTIVDLVTVREQNLYGDLLELIGQSDPALGSEPTAIYTVACRSTKVKPDPGEGWQLETWFEPLRIGQPLPTLPLWLADDLSIPLDLEDSYEATCKALHLA